MKTKLICLFAGIAFAFSLSAQKEIDYPNGTIYKECYYVKATKSLREIVKERDAVRNATRQMPAPYPHPAGDAEMHESKSPGPIKHDPGLPTSDGARQSVNGPYKISSPIVNIDGEPSVQGEYPLDPNGMIGSNYYVQTVNSYYAVYDKTGTKVLAGDLKDLFGALGAGDCGDPVTVYDKVADRWIITEFEGCETRRKTIDTILFAVSQTNDPTGAYWLYAFDPVSHNSVDDYPKFHVWADGYYMSCNCQSTDVVVAYQRDSMLKGATSALIAMPWTGSPDNYICHSCTGPGFFCPMMLDCDGTLPPYGSPEYLFYYWDPNWNSGGNNEIIINQVSINWTAKTGTITVNDTLPTTPFNSVFTGGTRADISQPGNNSSNYLDVLDGFFSYRIPYLRWTSYNSAVMANVVNVGSVSDRIGGIRWYELHQDTGTKIWSIYQQSTYAPNDGVSRWNPSIAMDQNGSIGIAYTVSDPVSVYPGCRYTGRRVCDPLDSMTVAEVNAYSGNAIVKTPQGAGNRWGDYSHLSVDPIDGITFWHTNMYAANGYSAGENIGTRIYSFQIPSCLLTGTSTPAVEAGAISAYQDGETLNIIGRNLPEGQRLVVELFDMNGKKLMEKEIATSANSLEIAFNISSLAKAVYLVRLGNDSFQRVIKVDIH